MVSDRRTDAASKQRKRGVSAKGSNRSDSEAKLLSKPPPNSLGLLVDELCTTAAEALPSIWWETKIGGSQVGTSWRANKLRGCHFSRSSLVRNQITTAPQFIPLNYGGKPQAPLTGGARKPMPCQWALLPTIHELISTEALSCRG